VPSLVSLHLLSYGFKRRRQSGLQSHGDGIMGTEGRRLILTSLDWTCWKASSRSMWDQTHEPQAMPWRSLKSLELYWNLVRMSLSLLTGTRPQRSSHPARDSRGQKMS
jgi:hypothetical protein